MGYDVLEPETKPSAGYEVLEPELSDDEKVSQALRTGAPIAEENQPLSRAEVLRRIQNAPSLTDIVIPQAVRQSPLGQATEAMTRELQRPMDTLTRVSEAVPADLAAKLASTPEFGSNIQTALREGKRGQPAPELPITKAITAAAQEAQFRGEAPTAAVAAKLSQAVAAIAPTIPGFELLPLKAKQLAGGAFLAQMTAQMPETVNQLDAEYAKPDAKRDYDKISGLWANAIQTLGLTGVGAVLGGGEAKAPTAPDRWESSAVQTPEPAARSAATEAAAMTPERPETLAAQMQWLQDGKRDAVLLTPGEAAPPLPEDVDLHPTDAGVFVFNPKKLSPEQIDQAVTDNKVGELLGYGIADKPSPENAAGVVVIRDANGIEKQAVVTDREHLEAVVANAKKLAGEGDTVAMETPEQVLARRQAPQAPSAPVETPAVRFAREQREAMAALRAQTPEPVAKLSPEAEKFLEEWGTRGTTPRNPDAMEVVQRGLGESASWAIVDHERGDIVARYGSKGLAEEALGDMRGQRTIDIQAAPVTEEPRPKPVEITPDEYRAARIGLNPFTEIPTARGLAKDIKRTQQFGQAALNERPGETQPQPVNQLFVGDQFKLKGEPVRVSEWVTDAETGQPAGVNVDGAYGRQFIPAGETVHIDQGTLSDPVSDWFDKAIAATDPLKEGQLLEGVTGAPVWMTKTAINGALKLAKFAYTKTRDVSRSVGEAIRFLRTQKLSGYNEEEALNWLESNLRGDPVMQDNGRATGAATQERRPLLNSSPRQNDTGGNTSTLPLQQDLQAAVTGEGWRTRVGGWLGNMAGETFPRTTRILRSLGEQGARWISSRTAALPLGDAFADEVTRGLNLDDVEFGAALHEDNLRSIKTQLALAWGEANAAGDTVKAAKLNDQVQRVFSFVGERGAFRDEAAYQRYLADPRVQEALARHRATWDRLIEPMYKEAMKIDPGEELPARGAQTGARINLNFVREGEPVGTGTYAASQAPRGQLSNVLQKKSPFGRLAKGTAAAYKPSYREAMRNTYSRQLEIANRNKFDRMMVDSGNAVIDRPGRQGELRVKGEGVTPFEIKRTVIQANGQRIPSFENIYVRNSIAPEYRSALNLDPKLEIPVLTPLSKLANGLALSGLTEISAHVGNLSHALLWRPGVTRNFWSEIALSSLGRADALVSIMRALRKFTAEDETRLRELAEIGALRDTPPEKANWNPAKWGGKLIERMDERTRLQLDQMHRNLAEQGLVPNTETARREFVNQIGQYNRRAQGMVMHALRDSGIAPFVTAGRAFNVLALRTAMLSPGIETTSAASRLAVAATMASKVTGTMILIGTLNYLLTRNKGGGVFGRPGVALGAVDTGTNDKNGRPLSIDVSNILGLKRVARVTGVRGAAESLRYNLPIGTTLDSAVRDVQNAWTAPLLGPVTRTLSVAATGEAPAKGVPRVAPVVPPGQSQTLQNVKTAALEANPIIAGAYDSTQPGATGWEWLQRQAGRFTLQPGKPPQMVAPGKYSTIVGKAQGSEYIDDVIMRARKMQGAERATYIRQAVMNLPPGDRLAALATLEHRGIIPPGVIPR